MGYFKPNTKVAIKICLAIKSVTAGLATTAYLVANAEIALVVATVGLVSNEVVNFISDAENPNTPI